MEKRKSKVAGKIGISRILIIGFFISLVLTFTGAEVTRSAPSSAEWIVNFEDAGTWVTNITLDDTQIRWDYAELKNGFNPAHEWYSSGEGSFVSGSTASSKLDNPNKKYSYRFTAPANKGVGKVGVIPYHPQDPPNYTVSIQNDNGTGYPDGNKLAEGTITGADASHDIWYFLDLSKTVNLVKRSVYHVVIEYKDGTIGLDNFWKSNAMFPQMNWTVGNYGGYDDNVDTPDPMNAGLWYTGTEWREAGGSPIFLLEFEDGSRFGQPYKHRYLDYVYDWRARQHFKVTGQNKTVTQLSIPGWVKGGGGIPDDGIHYLIKDENEITIRNGVLTDPPLQIAFTWYSDTFTPLELQKDKIYIIEIYSKPTNGYYLTIEASDVYPYEREEFQNATWHHGYADGDGYVKRSHNNGETWAYKDEARDIPFKLKLVEIFKGNITSIEKDAEAGGSAGDVWKQIKFEGSVPYGTSVGIEVNSSGCGGFVTVQDNAASETTYDLPSCAQERYASWKLVLHTDNSSITPKIYSVSFIGGDNSGDTIPPKITIKQIKLNGSVDDATVTEVEINGTTVTVTAGAYSHEVDVTSTDTITVIAANSNVNTVTRTVTIK